MTTQTITDPITDAVTDAVYAALEPVRRALHDRANTYGRHHAEYSRLIMLAVDMTVATEKVRDAVTQARDALETTPVGTVDPQERYRTFG